MISFNAQAFQQMLEHLGQQVPLEGCGLLAGEQGAVCGVFPATNMDHSPSTFLIDPAEQSRLCRQMRDCGWELVGNYHSHVETPAYPSKLDREMAFDPDAIYLVVSLADRERPVARAFRIRDGVVHEEELEIAR